MGVYKSNIDLTILSYSMSTDADERNLRAPLAYLDDGEKLHILTLWGTIVGDLKKHVSSSRETINYLSQI